VKNATLTRREVIKLTAALGLTPTLSMADNVEMLTRPIPRSGERLPVIGLGTYIVFDVGAEEVVGTVLETTGNRDRLFLASKVWTDGKAAGQRQMQRSIELMNAGVMDLMQVHNLRDTAEHLATIRDWQAEGRIRYSGVTHYRAGALGNLETAMKQHKPDFIQINYSMLEPEADQRVLPLAGDLGIAVLVNRPFVEGRLFRAVGDRPLPDWALKFAESWGQFFLKFIIGHPAVTAVIPATSKIHHLADNLGAGFGPLPDENTRRRMAGYFASL
jgi:diketogulonate reductase-like aldo/keto reductase